MDKTQKSREPERRRKTAPDVQKKTSAPRPEERKRPAAQRSASTEQKRPAPEEQKRSAQRPASTEQKRPAQHTQRPAASANSRPVRQPQRPAAPADARPTAAQQPKKERRSDVYGRPSAPQGTGPRKSAPQRSAQERAAQKRPAPKTAPKQSRQEKNPLKKLLGGSKQEKNLDPESALEQKRRQRQAAEAARKRRRAQMHDTPAVIYTAPQPFNRNRLFIQLLTVTAVVLALIMALSVFFKVETITVSGADKYSAWTVREASGIQEGDNLLTFSIPRASGQIIAKLSYVDKVRIGIKLPDTVNIYIEERDVAYAIKDTVGSWWLMSSDGKILEPGNSALAASHTQVLGVTVENPAENERAVAAEELPTETNDSGELIPVTVTGAQRLSAALQILKALEANDIVGDAASVDVTRLEDVILWYGTRYQVNLGSIHDAEHNMEHKIACMYDTILQLSDYQTGVLDVTFTTWQTQVGYTPFD